MCNYLLTPDNVKAKGINGFKKNYTFIPMDDIFMEEKQWELGVCNGERLAP